MKNDVPRAIQLSTAASNVSHVAVHVPSAFLVKMLAQGSGGGNGMRYLSMVSINPGSRFGHSAFPYHSSLAPNFQNRNSLCSTPHTGISTAATRTVTGMTVLRAAAGVIVISPR